ncbi:uncharacterized protein LOC141853108 [Brevipalpus obovatus]|uniref:uncharacterized protein LOC141853108 n=1 Tax=Brevipalpus obovatus TaxID=246614 RepID=UPI003D9E24F2
MLISWAVNTFLSIFLWPVDWFKSGPVLNTKALTVWAASDPLRDAEVAKIDASRFYSYLLWNSDEFSRIEGHKGVVRAISYLKIHAGKSRTRNVVWTKVFARLYAQNFVGISVKRLSGLQSIVYWLLRNTGYGSPVTLFCQTRLIAFILANRDTMWDLIRRKSQNLIIEMMERLSLKAQCTLVNWRVVIKYLVRKRHLFT